MRNPIEGNVNVPDGGWGWMVVLGAAFINVFNQSLLSIYGLLFGEKLKEIGENSAGASLVGNMMLLILNFSGIIVGPVLKRFSVRKVSIVASMLSSFGLIMASFADNKWDLIATYSIFTGLGLGLLQVSGFMAVNDYFKNHRGRAVGFSMAGTGVGQMLMPQIVRYLLDEYTYRGAALILGGLALNGIVGAALFQPLKWHLIRSDKEKSRLLNGNTNNQKQYSAINIREAVRNDKNGTFPMETSFVVDSSSKPLKLNDHLENVTTINDCDSDYENGSIESKKKSICDRIKEFFDLDLLADFSFINIAIGCSLGFTSNQSFNMFFPFFLQLEVGISTQKTAYCMSTIAAADILARMIVPIFTDKYKISSRITFIIGCLTLVVARTALSMQTEFVFLMVTSMITGFFRSAIVVNQNLTVSEHMKKINKSDKTSSGVGILMITKAISIITFGQLIGWFGDIYGTYVACFTVQNVLLLVIVVMWSNKEGRDKLSNFDDKELLATVEEDESLT